MSSFKIVESAPEKLKKGEYVVEAPNFRAEVAQCQRKKPRTNTLSRNYLREIVATIGDKYLGEDFDAIRQINITPYIDTPADTDEIVHNTVVKMFSVYYPKVFDAYIEHHLKNRPFGTELVYFTGNFGQTGKFTELGFHQAK